MFWNITLVKTQKSFEKLISLHKRTHYSNIALMEPFQSPSELDLYKRKLGMDKTRANCSAKIWIFWNNISEELGSTYTFQQITMQFGLRGSIDSFTLTIVYVRYSAIERLGLWEDLQDIPDSGHSPWIVGGGFNIILDDSEKMGGLPVTQAKIVDFANCMSFCALSELTFKESYYTWGNGRIKEDCILNDQTESLVIVNSYQYFLIVKFITW